ncbi:MAG TPA: hypothetical protein VGC67_05020 [Cellulomonas sp.]
MQRWLLHLWEDTRRSVLFVTHNIEEALLLSDTVYVLSARPARVLRRVPVPFARPRAEEVTDSPAFIRLRRELTDLLRPAASDGTDRADRAIPVPTATAAAGGATTPELS